MKERQTHELCSYIVYWRLLVKGAVIVSVKKQKLGKMFFFVRFVERKKDVFLDNSWTIVHTLTFHSNAYMYNVVWWVLVRAVVLASCAWIYEQRADCEMWASESWMWVIRIYIIYGGCFLCKQSRKYTLIFNIDWRGLLSYVCHRRWFQIEIVLNSLTLRKAQKIWKKRSQ